MEKPLVPEFGKKANSNQLDFSQEIDKYKRSNLVTVEPTPKQPIFEKPFSGIGPSKPVGVEAEDSSSSDDEVDINNPYYHKSQKKEPEQTTQIPLTSSIPSSHEVIIKGHKKGVTALDIDPKGYRMISGGNDYNVRLWDFQGMNKSMNSFRILEPYEGQPINKV